MILVVIVNGLRELAHLGTMLFVRKWFIQPISQKRMALRRRGEWEY